MTLKQLEVFLAVAETKSFSRGAELVTLAQATASQHVKALEDEIGTKLFDRDGGLVRLTEAGNLFLKHASKVKEEVIGLKSAINQFIGLESASLRIGASTIPAVSMIPDLLGEFVADYPGLRLEVHQGDSGEVINELVADKIELAVVGGLFDVENVIFDKVGDEQIVLVTKKSAKTPKQISLSELADLPLIIRETGSGTRQAVDDLLKRNTLDTGKLNVIAQLGSSEAVRRAVLGGAGWAFISSQAVSDEIKDGRLKVVRIKDLIIHRDFYLARRRGRTLSPAAVAFSGLLLKRG
jgi:DNA-binding transcriptional LysR family regulator